MAFQSNTFQNDAFQQPVAYVLTVESSSVTVTGQDVGLKAGWRLPVDATNVTVTGYEINLYHNITFESVIFDSFITEAVTFNSPIIDENIGFDSQITEAVNFISAITQSELFNSEITEAVTFNSKIS